MEGKNPARIADVSRTAVDKLLVDAGKACLDYQDKVFRNLPCRNIQCDEIWSFVYAKDKNSPFAQIDQRFDKFTPPPI
uniref:Uncharacterized protein n=1 Tax=Candidatus Kentrum sp. FM TaxID=2126340 RepID=A0A450X374_9GAMM|nr:MAG: hypothetical protein BECKFM1743A_GA0114220_102402 [Candidatus Kentron sp. FM]VFK23703.1 MAG: hypothetical protein BECKFM1743B_GA0114221_109412 [Candidatus Kentron sp. FM]